MLSSKDLKKDQKGGVKYLVKNNRVFLLADLGVGKTIIVLTALQKILKKFSKNNPGNAKPRMLIVAPPSVTENVWEPETDKWEHINLAVFALHSGIAPAKREELFRHELSQPLLDVMVVSSSMLPWFADMIARIAIEQKGFVFPFNWLVIDESSLMRSPQSKQAKICKEIGKYVNRVTLLTATPVPSDFYNWWMQCMILDGGERLGKTQKAFKERYFDVSLRDGREVVKLRAGCDVEILNKISDVCYRIKSSNKNKSRIVDSYISLPKKVMKFYDSFYEELLAEFFDSEEKMMATIDAANLGVRFMRCHQIASGVVMDENEERHAVHSKKLNHLLERLDTLGSKNVIIVYLYVGDRERMLKKVKGSKLFKGRKRDEDRWNANPNSGLRYIAHPASMSHGLNMQYGGSNIIWYTPTSNADQFLQLNGRLDRRGQEEEVIIERLIASGTVDERAIELCNRRIKMQDKALSHLE